ncbi:MAG: toll/interleukin-1 receptor domain-containing protein, partial [Pseudomonadota bacterium]
MAAGTDIFISYKREERALAQAYTNAFHSKGYVVATDLNVPEGTEFGDAIDTMIREATLVVVLWTPEAADSRWVRSEAVAAYKQDKYLGVLAEPVDEDDLPFEVRHTQYLDVTGHAQTTAIRTVTDSAAARIGQLRSAARAQETQQQRLAEDMEFFAKVHAVREPSGYQAYLNLYPRGVFHKEAKAEITAWTAWVRRFLGSPGAFIQTTFAVIGAVAAVYAIFAPPRVTEDGCKEIARLTTENTRLEGVAAQSQKTADALRTQIAEANEAAAKAGASEREKLIAAEQQRAKLQSDLEAAE